MIAAGAVAYIALTETLSPSSLWLLGASFAAFVLSQYYCIRVLLPQYNGHSRPAEESPDDTGLAMGTVEKYYVRLLLAAQRSVEVMHYRLDNSDQLLKNIDEGLSQASLLANETGVLAHHSVAAAAQAGEVGRGFVSVSSDVGKISQHMHTDILSLRALIKTIHHVHDQLKDLAIETPSKWLDSDGSTRSRELGCITEQIMILSDSSDSLNTILRRYENNPKRDVRWLQLSDSLTNVVNELLDAVSVVQEALQQVAKEMRIMKISDVLNDDQRDRIKGAIRAADSLDGKILEKLE